MSSLTPTRARATARAAYLFTFPLVVSYGRLYRQAIDTSSATFTGGFATWNDVIAGHGQPDQDVVYSSLWLDLRSEPWRYAVDEIPLEQSFSARWVDLWGFELESASNGENAPRGECVLAAPAGAFGGPRGTGGTLRGESAFVALLTETRWRDPYPIHGAPPIRPAVSIEPMGARPGWPGPVVPPAVDWWPLRDGWETGDDFWSCASFALSLITPHHEDRMLLERITEIGIVAGRPWHASEFPQAIAEAIDDGVDDALSDLMEAAQTGSVRPASCRGRADMDRDYFARALSALHVHPEALPHA